MIDFLAGSIQSLLQSYRTRALSPVEVCRAIFQRIDAHDSRIGAFLGLDRERAMKDAADAERDPSKPLSGIPVAIKDIISTRNFETTCGSRILKGYIPPYDATVIQRLRDAGAIIVGKTNCDEFAMGSSTENSAYQLTHNPWNLECTPGGSSGGSAAAIAACLSTAALGTDTGGSIRQPASLCGVVGLKPTYGRVSRYGLVAFGSSLDCIGPISRSAEDAAIVLQIIAGHDPNDSTSSSLAVPDYQSELNLNGKIRVGVPKEYFEKGIQPEVASKVEQAIRDLERAGTIEIKNISLPHSEFAIAVYYIIATAEASSNLSRYDGVKYGYRSPSARTLREMYDKTRAEGFGPEVKRRIMLGTFALSSGYYDAYYLQASRVRNLIAQDFQKAFKEIDLICAPTSPTTAFKLGEKVNDPLAMYLSDVYTVTSNLAGLPALSIPCGLDSKRLPIGLQIIGNYFDESRIFRLANAYMRNHPIVLPELSN